MDVTVGIDEWTRYPQDIVPGTMSDEKLAIRHTGTMDL